MLNNRTILATGIALLFILLSISPATANIFQEETSQELECLFFKEGKKATSKIFEFSEEESKGIADKISTFMENIESKHTYFGIMRAIKGFLGTDDSALQELFQNIDIDGVDLPSLGKRVFVVSHGRSNIINPFRKFQINLLRPATLFWYYHGSSDRILSDKTIIIDPYPSDIKVLDGRQVGIMRRFVGIYIYMPASTSSESNFFFIGYARNVFGLDLSPFD